MSDKPNPWDFIRQIQYKTTKQEYKKRYKMGWLFSFWLSHCDRYIYIVQRMNRVQMYVPDKAVYDYYFDKIPRGNEFMNLSKQDKEFMDERNKKIEEIKEEYNVSKREALLILIHKERL